MKSRLQVILMMSLLTSSCFAQSDASAVNATETPSIDQLKSGEEHAVFAAGNSGEKKYIPVLVGISRSGGHINNGSSRYAQMAAAKLGSEEQLAQISCEARHGSDVLRLDVLRNKIAYVGGSFAIHEYERLLSDSPSNTRPLSSSDEVGPTPMWIAINSLKPMVAGIAAEPPPDIKDMTPLRAAQVWLEWLQKNRKKLSSLKPSSSGPPLGKTSCRRYLDREMKK